MCVYYAVCVCVCVCLCLYVCMCVRGEVLYDLAVSIVLVLLASPPDAKKIKQTRGGLLDKVTSFSLHVGYTTYQ